MMLRKVLKSCVTVGCAALLSCSMLLSAHAAEGTPVPEKATEKAAAATTAPADLASLDTYTQFLQAAKEWIFANGPGVVVALLILVLGRWMAMGLAGVAQSGLKRWGVDQTLRRFLGKLLYYVLLLVVIYEAAGRMGIDTTSFLAVFGAAGLAVGLALKDSLANFASGVMLILFRPFKVGDFVTVNGVTGTVHQIDIFSTVILTGDNQRIIVPNGGITSSIITNINAEATRRIDMIVGIGYDDDIRLAKNTLEALLAADSRVLTDPAPAIAVNALADSSVNFIVRPWVKTVDYWAVHNDLTEQIKLTFDEKGISIPYPQQDVHMHQAAE